MSETSIEVVWETLDALIREGVTRYEREQDPSLLLAAAAAGRTWIEELKRREK